VIDEHERNVHRFVESIRARRSTLDAVARRLRTRKIQTSFNKWDANAWCLSVAGDTLVKIRLFTEHNFKVVETIGVIAVARYVFEISVWLRLVRHDRRYGLVYFHQLLDASNVIFKT
jgi:hypothetical protein